ncbi:MAG TPA: sodium:proton antiporter [Candidatus Eremiobacteraceae bacterium]|nr:sodium:proton antiporter [Candidatus Eremiobacteraceae bacterium]
MIAGHGLQLALLLGIVVNITIVTRRLRIPYTVGLVIAGLVGVLLPAHQMLSLTPELVLFVFLPPLLFAAGLGISVPDLRENWIPITLLATIGVLLGIAISYVMLHFGAGFSTRDAVLFGAMVAATDPVAVIAIFKTLRVNQGLASIVEGESMFNDGTSVVMFSALLAATAGTGSSIDFGVALGQFVLVTAGGLLVGLGFGGLALFAIRWIREDPLHVAVISVAAAYGSYFVADDLHVSGIFAVISAALVLAGARGLGALPVAEREIVTNFWSVVAFMAETLLFLLIGTSIDLGALVAAWPYAIWAIAAVLIGRPVIVYGLAPVSALLGRPLPQSWLHAITLSGMRGALSMALVLSLPAGFPDRALLVPMVFSVVLFTIIVQGIALEPLLKRLSLMAPDPATASAEQA